MIKEQIYCEQLGHWCKSVEEAAELAGKSTCYLTTMLAKGNRVTTSEGLTFVKVKREVQTPHSRKPVEVKCVETGETFRSILDLARILGKSNTGNVSAVLAATGKYVDKNTGNTYVYADPNHYNELCARRAKASTCVSKLPENINNEFTIKCEQTDDYFRSAAELAAYLNQDESSISLGLKNFGKFVAFNGRSYVAIKNNVSAKVEQSSKVKHDRKGRLIICEQTGEKFESMTKLANVVGCHPTHVSHSITNTKKFVWKGKTYVEAENFKQVIPTAKVTTQPVQKEETQVTIEKPVITTKVNNEKESLENTLMAFAKKGMYKEAAVLCETMQKIYAKQ